MLDWHKYQICYPLEIKLLLLVVVVLSNFHFSAKLGSQSIGLMHEAVRARGTVVWGSLL